MALATREVKLHHCARPRRKTGVSHETRGGELGVLRVHEHPLNVEVHPLTAKSTPQNERQLNETPFITDIHQSYDSFTFILGLYLCKTAVIHHFALNWPVTSGKAPPRVSTILHPCTKLYKVCAPDATAAACRKIIY